MLTYARPPRHGRQWSLCRRICPLRWRRVRGARRRTPTVSEWVSEWVNEWMSGRGCPWRKEKDPTGERVIELGSDGVRDKYEEQWGDLAEWCHYLTTSLTNICPSNYFTAALPTSFTHSRTHCPVVFFMLYSGSGLTYWWNKDTNETTVVGAPKPGHWVEVRCGRGVFTPLTYSLTHSLTHCIFRSLYFWLTAFSLTAFLTHSLTHALTHSPYHSLDHFFTQSLVFASINYSRCRCRSLTARDPAGSQLTYWWDKDSNATTALGSPKPHHSQIVTHQTPVQGSGAGQPTTFGGAMVQMVAVGFGMSLAMIGIRSIIG